MSYPQYVDNVPPSVTLKEYDNAPWAGTTCVDRRPEGFVIVVMEDPKHVVAKVHPDDTETLNAIFKSAHTDFSEQLVKNNGEVQRK